MVKKTLELSVLDSSALLSFDSSAPGFFGEFLLLRKFFWLGAVVAGTSTAMAETPAPTLIGAERIVIACEFDGSRTEAQQRGLCEQLVKKAQRYTSLPVHIAGPADTTLGANMRQQADQLLLRIRGETHDAGQGRKTLALEITPVRLARPMGTRPSLKSSVSMVEVEGNWVLQGPIDAFEKLLGGGPKRLAPMTSES